MTLINKRDNSDISTKTTSHTVIESIRRVFKIVVAEGRLNEIYNYENTEKRLNSSLQLKRRWLL